MKTIYNKICLLILIALTAVSCSDFDEINQKPDGITADEVSAKFFLTGTQILLYAPDRYPYWRAQLIHADRYAGQFTFGFSGSWWNDGLSYNYNSGYTDAAFDWMSGYAGTLATYMTFVESGGLLENEKYYAMGLIMKGLYYQMYTDTFGMVPYSEVGNPDIVSPKFDSQADIYQGVIAELDEAMQLIGDATEIGDGLAGNDLFFYGDLQGWKKLANTLKLRIALRAQGATGASFADAAVTSAMGSDLLIADNVLMEKDTEISQWSNAAYGDIWHNFGGLGSKWKVGEVLINYLRDNNDPRLPFYAQPIEGGEVVFTKPADGSGVALFDKHVNFILGKLDDANVSYTRINGSNTVTITIAPGEYYVGQPSRLNGDIYTHVKSELFSFPAEIITNPKNQGKEIRRELVFSAAEGNFLQAEAIIKGLATGDAEALYQEGLRQAMKLWDVADSDINTFIANEDMALLNGSTDENLEKIAIQRWIAAYTDGFEAWAIVRDTGYPSELANGVSDYDIFSSGDLNGQYPARMRYGNAAYNTNGVNTEAAVAIQGPDVQATKMWWAK
ncbi:MAG: SusD/RagB family nutrient-binding outer membrane lipoprotein [Flavobacteriaceae bacterium]|nr:SusD/RagB family nutrient-binding outer membrane lipoprotein [Flavobacteriaceae bacterium]MCB0486273.1 SusD/RagB family nutrient-binding outer membrane lipoprotein [Flavobacteriaceae bacterium]